MAGTRSRSSPPARSRTRTPHPQTTIDAVLALRAQLTADGLDAGPHTLHAHLQRHGLPAPSVTTIWRILTRAGVVVPEPRKRPRRSYIRFEADLPNECWQADFTHWPLADGTDTEILTFLDDHSRYAISVTAHRVVTGPIVLADVPHRHRAPRHPRSHPDRQRNGLHHPVPPGPNSFERELVVLGIEQKNGRPNHPQTQGKVERFQQTLKRWLRAQPPPTTLTELQTQLDTFADYYNTVRPHRSLSGRTPEHAYRARAKATPTGRDGHWRIRHDKIDTTGAVTLRHASRLHHIGIGTDPRRHPRPHPHPRPAHHRHRHRHRRDPARPHPGPHPRLPTPRTHTRTTQRQPPTRRPKTPHINEVPGHPLTMSRDFTLVAGAGFEPATSGL